MRTHWETAPQREFTANEIDALVRASGRFRVVAASGSLDVDVPFDNDRRAWRMVPVLQKVREHLARSWRDGRLQAPVSAPREPRRSP